MDASLGRLTARLAEPVTDRLQELVSLINSSINPPTPVTESDVYIRAMLVVSDEVNSFGGRFPSDELPRLAELLIDSPVLVGHRKDKLPIGRNFHAVVVKRDGKNWVKSYFYWLRSAEGAENLKENIDGGIYKECSVGFTYLFPECSICGKDIRTCGHEVFQQYTVAERKEACHFSYRRIERVLETSLVYRGAVPDTSVSKDLKAASGGKETGVVGTRKISGPSELDKGRKYLVTPCYEAIEVLATSKDSSFMLSQLNGERIDSAVVRQLPYKGLPDMLNVYAHLVGCRGKERCSVDQLRKCLQKGTGMVTRVELKLFPQPGLDASAFQDGQQAGGVRMIRHEVTDADHLDECSRKLMTKNGVLIWKEGELPPRSEGYHYRPGSAVKGRNDYTLSASPDGGDVWLTFQSDGRPERFRLKQFNLARLLKGGRFVADRTSSDLTAPGNASGRRIHGQVEKLVGEGGGFVLMLAGGLTGRFVLQPFKINGVCRFLFYRLATPTQPNMIDEPGASSRSE